MFVRTVIIVYSYTRGHSHSNLFSTTYLYFIYMQCKAVLLRAQEVHVYILMPALELIRDAIGLFTPVSDSRVFTNLT